jgi:hypothetical protein
MITASSLLRITNLVEAVLILNGQDIVLKQKISNYKNGGDFT